MAANMLRLPSIAVPDDNPFANDALDRKPLVESLTQIIDSVEHPFVFAITGPWGCGKSTFLELWSANLRKSGHDVIRFNAWENDFSDSALATMLAELGGGVSALADRDAGTIQKAAERVVAAGKVVARHLIPATAKLLTLGALDLDEITEDVIAEVAQTVANEAVNSYGQAKQSIHEFKAALATLVDSLAAQEPPSRLVIAVDELDRCRPSYALEMLEVMKHLFDVGDVTFILAVDVTQLRSSVAAVYGPAIDGTEYLRRFIDMQFALPEPTAERLLQLLWTQASLGELIEPRRRFGKPHAEIIRVRDTLGLYLKLFPNLAIRFHQQIVTRLSVVLRTMAPDWPIHPDVLVFLLYLRELSPDTYIRIRRRTISPWEAVSALCEHSHRGNEFTDPEFDEGMRLEASLACALEERHAESKYTEHYEKIVKSSTVQAEKSRADWILSVLEREKSHRRTGWIDYLTLRIDLGDRFVDQTKAGG